MSSGNVGIGTTNPQAKLDVNGTIKSTGICLGTDCRASWDAVGSFWSGSSSGNIWSNNDGNVGIGTSVPNIAKLQINAPTGTEGIRLVSSNYSPLVIRNTADSADLFRLDEVGRMTIASSVKIGNSTDACDSSQAGAFKYDSVSGQSYLCNGSRWLNQRNCGLMTDDDGNIYNTVQIGGQCWMAENINVGVKLATGATLPSSNNQIIEKWCYDNSDTNCANGGGLYHWDEAMKGSQVSGAQGICPVGWHIPTDAEFNILEKTVLGIVDSPNSQYTCDLSTNGWRRCADNSGTDLGGAYGVGKSLRKVNLGSGVGVGNNLAGFEGDLPGHRVTAGGYGDYGNSLRLWSSTASGASAFAREFYISYSVSGRGEFNKGRGHSVRCIKD